MHKDNALLEGYFATLCEEGFCLDPESKRN